MFYQLYYTVLSTQSVHKELQRDTDIKQDRKG